MSHNYNFQRTADLALKLQEATARVADVESYVLAQVSTGHSRAIVPTARTDVDQMGGLDELIYDVAALLKSTTKSLTRTLRAVARRRNEFVNINSLPEEILRPIFLHASGDNMYHKFSIADTCVPWRNICIAFPGFWTDFEVPHAYDVASRAFTIAEQAGLPLRLKIDWNATPYKVIQLVDARGKLIEHLEITEWSSRYQFNPLTSTFPLLRRLHVEARSSGWTPDYVSADLVPSGQLKEVVLVGCHLANLLPASYAGLTRLSLVHAFQRASHSLTHVVNLVEVLRASPELEELILHRVPILPPDSLLDLHSQIATASVIPLPRLRYLDLTLYPEVMTYLLARFRTSHVLYALVLTIDIPVSFEERQAEEYLVEVKDYLLCLSSRECFPMLSTIGGLFIHHKKTSPTINRYRPPGKGPASAVVPKSYPVPFLFINLLWNVNGDMHGTLEVAYTNLFTSIASHHHMPSLSRVSIYAGVGSCGEPYLSPTDLSHVVLILAAAPNVAYLEVIGFIEPTGPVEVFLSCISSAPMLGELSWLLFGTCDLSEQAIDQLAEGITHLSKLERLELVDYFSHMNVVDVKRRLRRDGLAVRWKPVKRSWLGI